jgi:hypothetical protein
MVTRKEVSERDDGGLQELDVILEVQGKIVTSIKNLDVSEAWPSIVKAKILRDKQVVEIDVPTHACTLILA